MIVLIGQQVINKCVFSAMKHVSDIIDSLQVVRIYSFLKEIKLFMCALYIVFLFVKPENKNFIN